MIQCIECITYINTLPKYFENQSFRDRLFELRSFLMTIQGVGYKSFSKRFDIACKFDVNQMLSELSHTNIDIDEN